jgi:hypothetical protein
LIKFSIEWNKLKGTVIQAANKVLGRYSKNTIKGAYGV